MHHKHRDTLTLGQIMISLWYPAWDQAHRDHVKKKRKNSKHKRGMTAITAVLGLSVPPRSKWVVYKHNFSVTGLQSQGGSFQSKGHKFSAKQSRLVKKKKIPFKRSGRGGRRNERTSWQTVHTSCFYVWPTHHSCEHNLPLDPTGKLKVPFSILNSCRWPPGTLSGFIPPAYSFVFCLVFCFFESSGRQVTWGWTSRRAALHHTLTKCYKTPETSISSPLIAVLSYILCFFGSLACLAKGKGSSRERNRFVFVPFHFILLLLC